MGCQRMGTTLAEISFLSEEKEQRTEAGYKVSFWYRTGEQFTSRSRLPLLLCFGPVCASLGHFVTPRLMESRMLPKCLGRMLLPTHTMLEPIVHICTLLRSVKLVVKTSLDHCCYLTFASLVIFSHHFKSLGKYTHRDWYHSSTKIKTNLQ